MRSVGPRKIVIRSGSEPAAHKLSRSVSGTPSYTPSRSGSSRRRLVLARGRRRCPSGPAARPGRSSRASPTASSNSSACQDARTRPACHAGGRRGWGTGSADGPSSGAGGAIVVCAASARRGGLGLRVASRRAPSARAARARAARTRRCSARSSAPPCSGRSHYRCRGLVQRPRASTVVVGGSQLGRGDGVDAVREVEVRDLARAAAPCGRPAATPLLVLRRPAARSGSGVLVLHQAPALVLVERLVDLEEPALGGAHDAARLAAVQDLVAVTALQAEADPLGDPERQRRERRRTADPQQVGDVVDRQVQLDRDEVVAGGEEQHAVERSAP